MTIEETIQQLKGNGLLAQMVLPATNAKGSHIIILVGGYNILFRPTENDGQPFEISYLQADGKLVSSEVSTIDAVVDHALEHCRIADADQDMVAFALELKDGGDPEKSAWAKDLLTRQKWTLNELAEAVVFGFNP